jgi:ABC-2 type transport system permease protein
MMLSTLIHKEALVHLLSLRFNLSLALVIGLMTAGALMYRGELTSQLEDVNATESERQERLAAGAERPGSIFQVYSYYDQPLLSRPSILGFVADGHERDLPNKVRINAFRWLGPEKQQRGNAMLLPFDAIDWVLVVSIVLSFAAIVLTFDGFAGEKEDGTLRLVLANPVPRWQLVVAKATGAWVVLALALVIGVLIQLLILLPGGWLRLDPQSVARLAGALLLCGLFTGVFVLIGLLISALHRSSASALVVALLVWVLLVVIVPRSAVLLAHWLHDVNAATSVAEAAEQAMQSTMNDYQRLHPESVEWFSGHWSPGESPDMAFAIWQAWKEPYRGWYAAQVQQVMRARRVAWLSPVILLAEALEQVAGSGLVRYQRFLAAADQYQLALAEDLRAVYPFETVNGYGRDREANQQVLAIKVSSSDLPVFQDRSPALGEVVESTFGHAVALTVINLVLLLATVSAAVRYDVR